MWGSVRDRWADFTGHRGPEALAKLAELEGYVVLMLPEFGEYSADAQIAILAIAAEVGPNFPETLSTWTHAVRRRDWLGAKASCTVRGMNNEHSRLCFENAATVEEYGMPRELLHWPAKADPADYPPGGGTAHDSTRAYKIRARNQEIYGDNEVPTRPTGGKDDA